MMRKQYSCDLCRENRQPEALTGLNFRDMHYFTLSAASATDGTHICSMCIEQLCDQLKIEAALPGDGEA